MIFAAAALLSNSWTGGSLTAEQIMGEVEVSHNEPYDVSEELAEARRLEEEKAEREASGWIDRLGLDRVEDGGGVVELDAEEIP